MANHVISSSLKVLKVPFSVSEKTNSEGCLTTWLKLAVYTCDYFPFVYTVYALDGHKLPFTDIDSHF